MQDRTGLDHLSATTSSVAMGLGGPTHRLHHGPGSAAVAAAVDFQPPYFPPPYSLQPGGPGQPMSQSTMEFLSGPPPPHPHHHMVDPYSMVHFGSMGGGCPSSGSVTGHYGQVSTPLHQFGECVVQCRCHRQNIPQIN